jgi:sigma-B regulation protein RsbU (phosphoserine phosphatase)
MLPRFYPQTPGCEIAGDTRFADAAGGDFLDCVVGMGGDVTLMIGDASGHGFASALVSVATKAYLRALGPQYQDLGELLTRVNQLLVEDLAEGRFVTLFVGQLLADAGHFRYAGAGHNGYILSPQCELKTQLISTGPPLGWFPGVTYTVSEAAVERGDYILLMTDGIEESFSADDQPFGRDRIFQTIAELADRPVAEQAQGILDAVRRFTNNKQTDDMTVLLTRLK